MVIKSSKELFDHVYGEYEKGGKELDSTLFDFDVQMSLNDILETYARLQRAINDDIVYYHKVDASYTGNCARFLLSCNYKTGYSRFHGDKQVSFIN